MNIVEDMMRSTRTLAGAMAMSVLLAGCMHHRVETVENGDISVDSLSASRTALLRVQNNYPTEVRVYAVIGGQENYIVKAMPGETRTVVLDPTLFPAAAISFDARPADKHATKTVGPLKVARGETVELVLPAMIENATATVHRSTP